MLTRPPSGPIREVVDMRVLVTGATGLVGSQLVKTLKSQGHEVLRLVRGGAESGDVAWNPSKREIDKSKLEGLDAVVHLAGENIASGRWTAEKKEKIRNSRVEGTKFLSETLASLDAPPDVLVSASAIGYYGDRCDEVLTEKSSSGQGFLAEVCREWESATAAAMTKGIRVVNVRIGVVLSTKGGALQKMLPPFKMGGGGKLGSGKQYMSWIALDDLIGVIQHAITNSELTGPVNAVAPDAVTNEEFTSALGSALHRPTIFPVPGFAVHLLLGEMADELLLSSARVTPEKVLASGYAFKHPHLQPTLVEILNAA